MALCTEVDKESRLLMDVVSCKLVIDTVRTDVLVT
jgi:hypothetical protein